MHPLQGKTALSMRSPKPYAAVIAHRKSNQLIVQQGSVHLVKQDTLFAPIDGSNLQVVAVDGTPIKPEGAFYISLETIDPMHLIIDWR